MLSRKDDESIHKSRNTKNKDSNIYYIIMTSEKIESKEDEKAEIIRDTFIRVSQHFLEERGCTLESLKSVVNNSDCSQCKNDFIFAARNSKILLLGFLLSIAVASAIQFEVIDYMVKYAYGIRCIVPNNYFVWEFTRPVSDCEFCRGVDRAIILPNVTKDEFKPYAYTSRPVIVKGAASHWPASNIFSLKFFRDLYESIDGAYTSVEEECQFLHFKSNFAKLRNVLEMSEARALNLEGEEPWYVGWKNCHPRVLEIMNEFYKPPHFLPDDAEIPRTNYIFMGYDQGAIMHLDYIPRLMWQGQILGSKTWTVAPTPECENLCKSFNFSVDTGDIILIDTRIWYHGTYVENGRFSLTVTSEYG